MKPDCSPRFERVPGIEAQGDLSNEAFTLTRIGQLLDKPVKGAESVYVVRLKEKTDASPEDFEKEKQSYIDRLRQGKVETLVSQWLKSIRDNSEITIEERVLQ